MELIPAEGWQKREDAIKQCETHLTAVFDKLQEALEQLSQARRSLIGYSHVYRHDAAVTVLEHYLLHSTYDIRRIVNTIVSADDAGLVQAPAQAHRI